MSLRAFFCFALVSGIGLSSAVAASPDSDVLKITLDQAKVAKVPGGTTTLVVGNPAIADVTMLKGGVGMVVTGKGYGQTNLVAIDADSGHPDPNGSRSAAWRCEGVLYMQSDVHADRPARR